MSCSVGAVVSASMLSRNTLTSFPLYKMPTTCLYFVNAILQFLINSFSHFFREISSDSDFVSKIIAGIPLSSGRYQPSGLSTTPLNPNWLNVVICPVPCFTLGSDLSNPRIAFALSRSDHYGNHRQKGKSISLSDSVPAICAQ